MPLPPFIIKDLFDDRMMKKLKGLVTELKQSQSMFLDSSQFHRYALRRVPLIELIHHEFVMPLASEIFQEKLKPSYSYLSCYIPGEGICPLHVDNPACYRTIDFCLNREGEWPLFVNSMEEFSALTQHELETNLAVNKKVRAGAQSYLINEGEALCYSGTAHPHWREKAKKKIYTDLLFFHFVPQHYQGSLD